MQSFSRRARAAVFAGIAALALFALTADALAQISSAQQSAIKASCRSDFMSKCSGVRPGGADALKCLQTNVAGLSPDCRKAVASTLPPPAPPPQARPAPPPAPPPQARPAPPPAPVAAPAPAPAQPRISSDQQNAIKASCRSDFMSKCSGVSPGGADAMKCLQTNVAGLSPDCRKAVAATLPASAPPPQAAPAPAAAPPPAAAPSRAVIPSPPPRATRAEPVQRPAAPAAIAAPPVAAPAEATPGPTPQQVSAIKATCGGDFRSLCRGVPQGGPEAIACLQNNVARLSPDCRISVVDVIDSMPEGAPAAVPAAAPAAEEKRRLPPGITPAGKILRRAIERRQDQ